MLTLLAVALLGMSAPDPEETGAPIPLHLSLEEAELRLPQDSARGDLPYLQASVRFTIPGGEVATGSGIHYSDLFGTGIGGGAQAGYLWRLSKSVLLGAYLEADVDSFSGKNSSDSFGTVLKPDSMDTVRTLVGGKVREEFGSGARFYSEQYLALGANFYPSVGGTLTSGGVAMGGNLFSSKTAVAFDLGTDIGWSPSRQIDLFVGFVIAINGGPGEGKDIVVVGSGSSRPGSMVNTGINLGININF